MRNVFDEEIVNESTVPFEIWPTLASPTPARRAMLAGKPDWLVNDRTIRGSSVPAVIDWSWQDAENVPSGVEARTLLAPVWLSSTVNGAWNAFASGTSARNLLGIWPLLDPPRAVATRLPLARLLEEPAGTALSLSTAPALRAKSTAAAAVPVVAITMATMDRTVPGEGLRSRMVVPPGLERRKCGHGLMRNRRHKGADATDFS